MKLAVTLAILCAPSLVGAATLQEFGSTVALRPASSLVEASCDVDVTIDAGVTRVESKHKLVNHGAVDVGGIYQLDLPDGARVTGATISEAGTDSAALLVGEGYGTDAVKDTAVLGADPIAVQAVGPGSRGTRYQATVEPLAPDHEVTMTLKWTMPTAVHNGALRIDLPGRASEGTLGACKGALHASAGPGATVTRLRAGTATGTKGGMTFSLGDVDLALDAELAFARPEPIVWTQKEDLGGGWTGGVVTVVAPPASATAPIGRRVMFVIDTSRSMDMVGGGNVAKIVDAVAAALPAGTAMDAILYDRKATRIGSAWTPMDRALPALRTALAQRGSTNGSDLTAALALAHTAIADGAREQTTVVVITDGVLGQLSDTALAQALDGKPSALDVHAIVLDPEMRHEVASRFGLGATASPNAPQLERLISLYGGTYVEVAVDDLDAALQGVDAWVRPSWVDLGLTGVAKTAIPATLRAGEGGVATFVVKGAMPAIALEAHGDAPFRVPAKDAGGGATGGILAMADAAANPESDLYDAKTRAPLLAKHAYLDDHHAFVALSLTGKVARNRKSVVEGGGPFTRMVSVTDPSVPHVAASKGTPPAPSAIDKLTVDRLLRDTLQPAAYACYGRSLGSAPKLAGTVHYDIHMSRGEVTSVGLIGLGNEAFDACLVEAAFKMQPPLPDLRVNSDDQTVVHYPLTFDLSHDKPTVIAGDADSDSPIDIDAIQGGVPTSGRKIKVETSTPLGGLKPTPSP